MDNKGVQIKKLIKDNFGLKIKSVTKGRGTASNWIYIEPYEPIDQKLRDKIEELIVKEKLCGSYFTDFGFNDDYSPCISWKF